MKRLTFDIEDWWIYEHYQIGSKLNWLPRLDNYLARILDLLDIREIKATFFVLGEVAKNNPEVVKRIDARGHHIGCHSYSHTFWRNAKPDEVVKDTKIALDVIENCIGRKVNAYRAPAFSITEQNKWILSILADNGIEYDCSIFPATRSYGGFPTYSTKEPAIIEIDGYQIKEFPMAPVTILGHEIVYSGGGYFRLFPYWKIKSLVEKSDYVMTYFHIKDFDKHQKRFYSSFESESALLRYVKNYCGLSGNFGKFSKFIFEFDFISLEQANALIDWRQLPIIRL